MTGPARASECEDALLGEWTCSTLNDIPGVNWLYGRIGDTQRQKVEAATDALGDVVPGNFIEEWVKGMAESTVNLLSAIQALGDRVTAPAFDQRWWAAQYATSFGLSLVLLAFLLVWITARFAAAGSSATATDLFRQSGWRLVFVVPLICAGPLVLLHLQLAANELARAFADEGKAHAQSAVERLMDLIVAKAGDWGVFGGTVLALLLFLLILCLGLVTLIEMAVAQWGLHLGALLVPLGLVTWVYPPWSGTLRRLAALITGLMLLPAFIYFFFHTIWSAFDFLMADDQGDDGLSILLFLAVGLLMIDAFPLVVMWLMSLTTAPATGMDPEVRGIVAHPSAGEMAAGVVERFETRVSQLGTSRPADDGGGDGPADAGGGEPDGPPTRHGPTEADQATAPVAAASGTATAAHAAERAADQHAGSGVHGSAADPARTSTHPGSTPGPPRPDDVDGRPNRSPQTADEPTTTKEPER